MAGFNLGNYAGIDALGRKLPSSEAVGLPRQNRYVGMFYFINLTWSGDIRPFRDNMKIWAETPEAFRDVAHPIWDTDGCYWGEPLFGYYDHGDEWVIRRHVMLLILAGVDFIVFDTTNLTMHRENALKVIEGFHEFRQRGWEAPRFAFYTNSESGIRAQEIYESVYKEGRYEESWFQPDGKPLLIARPELCSEEVRDFFDIRLSQWPTEQVRRTGDFPWMAFERPQTVFLDRAGGKEVISVSPAQHPQIKFGDSAFHGEQRNRGRSFHQAFHTVGNDCAAGAVNWGYNIAEQWEYAIDQDPRMVFVTGWNEWAAGPFKRPEDRERPVTFIDTASQEYSRDLEPMRGGHFDNYYMQLADYVRRYKGCGPIPEGKRKVSIDIDGDFSQWEGVETAYRGFPFFEISRNHMGMDGRLYVNESGRNVFDVLKVAWDDDNVYFYAKCFEPITAYNFTPWMLLFLRVVRENQDPLDHPSWAGYHYLVNHELLDGRNTLVYECLGGWRWKSASVAPIRCEGREFHMAVPRPALGLAEKGKFRIEFKWADHISETEDVDDFYLNGCSAPYGRMNFVYLGGCAEPE